MFQKAVMSSKVGADRQSTTFIKDTEYPHQVKTIDVARLISRFNIVVRGDRV